MKDSEKIVNLVISNTYNYYSSSNLVYIIEGYCIRRTNNIEKDIGETVITFHANNNFFDILRNYYGKTSIVAIPEDEIEELQEIALLFDEMYEIEQQDKDKYDPDYINWVLYGNGWKKHLKEESDQHIVEIVSGILNGGN